MFPVLHHSYHHLQCGMVWRTTAARLNLSLLALWKLEVAGNKLEVIADMQPDIFGSAEPLSTFQPNALFVILSAKLKKVCNSSLEMS